MSKPNNAILKRMTVYIAYPTGDRYIEIKSPIDIQTVNGVVSITASDGTTYTAHITNILSITKPEEETEETDEN